MTQPNSATLLAEGRRALAFAEGLASHAAAMARQKPLPPDAVGLQGQLQTALGQLRAALAQGQADPAASAQVMRLARDLDRVLRPLLAAAQAHLPGQPRIYPPSSPSGPKPGPSGAAGTRPLGLPGPQEGRRQATTPLPAWGDMQFPPLPSAPSTQAPKPGPSPSRTGPLPARPAPGTGALPARPVPSPSQKQAQGTAKLTGWLQAWLPVDAPAAESQSPPVAPELQHTRLALKLVGSVLAYASPRLAVVDVALRALGSGEEGGWWEVQDRLETLSPSLPPAGQGWAAPLARMFLDRPLARRPAVIAVGQWGATREAFEACEGALKRAEAMPTPDAQRRGLNLVEVAKLKGLAVPISHLHLTFKEHSPLRDLFPTPAKPS